MHTRIMKVTPQLAAEYLSKNHSQRPIRRSAVEKYKKQLETKTFFTTHQGIAFDEEERLRDGQNRLTAIVETGIPAKMLVTTGLTEEAVMAIDDGQRRTDAQALTMYTGEEISSFVTAIAREMYSGGTHLTGGRRRKASRLDLISFYDKYQEQINYAANAFKNHHTGMALSFIAAVVARAAVNHSGRRLDHFANVLSEGFSKEGDEMIIRLRNHILQQRRAPNRGQAQRDMLYAKTEKVLDAYLKRTELPSVLPAKEELFPLEEDPQTEREGGAQ